MLTENQQRPGCNVNSSYMRIPFGRIATCFKIEDPWVIYLFLRVCSVHCLRPSRVCLLSKGTRYMLSVRMRAQPEPLVLSVLHFKAESRRRGEPQLYRKTEKTSAAVVVDKARPKHDTMPEQNWRTVPEPCMVGLQTRAMLADSLTTPSALAPILLNTTSKARTTE
jgi:hypothetical protein